MNTVIDHLCLSKSLSFKTHCKDTDDFHTGFPGSLQTACPRHKHYFSTQYFFDIPSTHQLSKLKRGVSLNSLLRTPWPDLPTAPGHRPSLSAAAAAGVQPALPLTQTSRGGPVAPWTPGQPPHPHWHCCTWWCSETHFLLFHSPDENLSTSRPRLTEQIGAPWLSKKAGPSQWAPRCLWPPPVPTSSHTPSSGEMKWPAVPWAFAPDLSSTWNAFPSCLTSFLPLVSHRPAPKPPSRQSCP